jgi:beta-glucuronidase
MQVKTTRDMVRASFNHPSVIIYGFLNECASDKKEAKALVDRLIETIRAERTGRLVTFACCNNVDICNENTDIIGINTYPGGIPPRPGTKEELKEIVRSVLDMKVSTFRKKNPGKPIIISESGCGAVYGMRGEYASVNTEDFQAEYLECLLREIWANTNVCGYAIWQMNDGRTRERFGGKAVSAMFGGSVAGVFDRYRRAKLSAEVIKRYFSTK